MADTTHLQLPLIAAAQAQKHVTHNDALLRLDALVQLSVASRGQSAPPAAPSDGERHIPAPGATGAWTGWDLNVAWFVDGVWTKLVPREGWRVWVDDEDVLLVWDGTAWTDTGGGSGDVVGPGSAIDGRPALFDGASGKLLKEHPAPLGTAAAQSYAEGTWTPSLVGVTAGEAVHSVQRGSYIRIGNLAMASLRVVTSDTSALSGSLGIDGLPFAANLDPDFSGRVSFVPGFWTGITLPSGATNFIGFLLDPTRIRLFYNTLSSGTNAVAASHISGNITIYGNLVYRTV